MASLIMAPELAHIPAKNLIYCHNCGWSSRPLKWIMQAGGITREDISREVEEGEFTNRQFALVKVDDLFSKIYPENKTSSCKIVLLS